MAVNGATYNGGSFGPGATFGSGNTFIGVTFRAPCYFGDGNMFENCTFERCCAPHYSNPWSELGTGNVFTGTTFDYVNVGTDAVIHDGTFLSVSFGSGTVIESTGISWGVAKNKTSPGHIIASKSEFDFMCQNNPDLYNPDWATRICRDGYILLNTNGEVARGSGEGGTTEVKMEGFKDNGTAEEES